MRKKYFLIPLFLLLSSISFGQTEITSDTMNAYTDRYTRFYLDETRAGGSDPINLLVEIFSTRVDTFYIFRQTAYGKPSNTVLTRQKLYDFRTSETLVDSVVVNKTTYETTGAVKAGVWNSEVVIHTPYGGGYWYLYRKGDDSLSTHSIWSTLKRQK